MNTATEEKKSSTKKIFVTVCIVVLVAIILLAAVGSQFKPISSSYVEVDYKIVGWYYEYSASGNDSYLLLNLTITNKGYTDGVEVYPLNPLSLEGFGLNISNTIYNPVVIGTISNSSDISGFSYIYPSLKPVTLLNNGIESGTILFEVPKQQFDAPFSLQCSMTTTKYEAVSVKISGS